MRCSRALCVRKDIVELLVSRGRLADIQMLNYFSAKLDREMGAASGPIDAAQTAAGDAGVVSGAKKTMKQIDKKDVTATALGGGSTEVATPTTATAVAATEAESGVELQRAQSREAKRKAWKDFQACSDKVRHLAANGSPTAWMKEVYGEGEELCSCLTMTSAVPARTGDGALSSKPTLKVSGIATVAYHGAPGDLVRSHDSSATAAAHALPKAISIILPLNSGKEDTPRYVNASVPLNQPGVVERRVVNSVLRVHLKNADAVEQELSSAEEMMSHRNVLTATAYSTILSKMAEIGALHATNSVRYDALRIRNPAVQMRLAQLECFRYGMDCLTDYVVGDPDVLDGDEVTQLSRAVSGRLPIPLTESLVLKVYAQRAFMDGMDGMWETVRDTPLVAAIAHRSNPGKMIDYPYLARLLNSSKYLLMSSGGSKEAEVMTLLHPLFSRGGSLGSSNSGSTSGIGGLLESMVGLTSGHGYAGLRLAAPHVNLAGMARALELDVSKLINVIASEKDRSEPIFVLSVAHYMAELLANLAVIYRCTAALNVDEEGRGHREWLLAQAFGGTSAMRRQRIMDDYAMSRATKKVLKNSADLDSYSTHPIELMNASPRKIKSTGKASVA